MFRMVMERWLSKVEENQDVGIVASYKYNQRLFEDTLEMQMYSG